MWRQISHCHFFFDSIALISKDAMHVQWRPKGWHLFAKLAHPIVVDKEMLSTRQGVPRF